MRFRWLTPAAPAAIAIARVAAHPPLIDRPLPAIGAARRAHLVDPAGAAVDDVVVARVDGRALLLMCHGGAGVRAACSAALRAHGLVEDYADGDDARWSALAAAPSPAAARWLLAHGDATPAFAAAFLRRPPTVLIAGPPNAGKSTLLNAWCGHPRALVADEAGTTRDLVAADAVVAGWRLTLIDSAGLRAADDPLERAGQDLARSARATADLVLFLDPADGDGAERPLPGDLVVSARADRAAAPRPADARWSALGADGASPAGLLLRLQRLVLDRLRLPADEPYR